ncbi:hypothetical protein D3C72_1097580 [compost metagenome]
MPTKANTPQPCRPQCRNRICIAWRPASAVPASPWGGCSMWVRGSDTQKKNKVMLMPAANSMPAHDR